MSERETNGAREAIDRVALRIVEDSRAVNKPVNFEDAKAKAIAVAKRHDKRTER